MADEAAETLGGGLRAFLGAGGFLVMMFGGYHLYEGKDTRTGIVLIALGLPIFLSAAIWTQIRAALSGWERREVAFLFIGIGVIFLAVGIYMLAMRASADVGQSPPIAVQQPNPPPVPPAKAHSKQAINELLNESGEMLAIVEKVDALTSGDWNNIANIDPLRVYLEGGSAPLQKRVLTLADELRGAEKSMFDLLEKYRIDRGELEPLLAPSPILLARSYLGFGANTLTTYANALKQLGDHSTPDTLRQANLPRKYADMLQEFVRFANAHGSTKQRIIQYQDALRIEGSNAS